MLFRSQGLLLATGKVLITGGFDRDDGLVMHSRAELFDPGSGRSQLIDQPRVGRLFATATVPLTVKNTGSIAWRVADKFDASYHVTRWDDTVVVWDGLRSALPDVAPGQTVTINVPVQAPDAGSYVVKFDLVQEGVTWFSGQGIPTGNVAAIVR